MYKSLKLLLGLVCSGLPHFQTVPAVHFKKQLIAAESFESVGVMDVNGDQQEDIVSGSYWYEGPQFLKRHYIGPVKRVGEYYDDFSCIPMDVNGDGKIDFITGGWFDGTLRWRENPGNDAEWPMHDIAVTGNIESTRAWDIDGDGFDEIVPNTPGKPLAYYTLIRDKSRKGQFLKTTVTDTQGHGLGFGDINGDGRGDLIVADGWLEAPVDRKQQAWVKHNDFNLGDVSVPLIVADVNKDGLNDLIAGQAHGYGLDWYEQKKMEGKILFIKHPIDPFHSQYHTMAWVDIDNDGDMELVTGKRYRAHNGNNPGDNDYPSLYYFKWNGESFTKNIISYGPFGEGKGTGVFFTIADLQHSGRKDIVVAGKDGLCVFYNLGNEQ
jgi:hypothetical protein